MKATCFSLNLIKPFLDCRYNYRWKLSNAVYIHIYWGRPRQPVARGQHLDRGNIWIEKSLFNSFPGKTEIELQNQIFEFLIYRDVHYVTNSFCKNVLKTVTPPPSLGCEMHFVYMFPIVVSLCGKLVLYVLRWSYQLQIMWHSSSSCSFRLLGSDTAVLGSESWNSRILYAFLD